MDKSFKWFCEKVSWVFNPRYVVDVNDPLVDTGVNEVKSDVNMFHFGVCMGVMCACHSALVVTV